MRQTRGNVTGINFVISEEVQITLDVTTGMITAVRATSGAHPVFRSNVDIVFGGRQLASLTKVFGHPHPEPVYPGAGRSFLRRHSNHIIRQHDLFQLHQLLERTDLLKYILGGSVGAKSRPQKERANNAIVDVPWHPWFGITPKCFEGLKPSSSSSRTPNRQGPRGLSIDDTLLEVYSPKERLMRPLVRRTPTKVYINDGVLQDH